MKWLLKKKNKKERKKKKHKMLYKVRVLKTFPCLHYLLFMFYILSPLTFSRKKQNHVVNA